MKMLRIAGVLALVTLGLSASHTKGTVGEGQLPPHGAPLIVRCGSTEYVQKCSDKSTVALISEWSNNVFSSALEFSRIFLLLPVCCWHLVITMHFYLLVPAL